MARTASLFLFLMYFMGLFSFGSPASFAIATKIKIYHSHAIAPDEHHAHSHDDDHPHDHAAGEEPPNGEHHHTHEIFVVGNALYPVAPQTPELAPEHIEDVFRALYDRQPPREPALNSIFRPPIA